MPVSFTDCHAGAVWPLAAVSRPSQLRLMNLFSPHTGEPSTAHGAEALSVIPISLIQVSPQTETKVPWQGRPDRD
jgi:hypothetical protein